MSDKEATAKKRAAIAEESGKESRPVEPKSEAKPAKKRG